MAEIEHRRRTIFDIIYKGSHNRFQIEKVRFVRPDVAVVFIPKAQAHQFCPQLNPCVEKARQRETPECRANLIRRRRIHLPVLAR